MTERSRIIIAAAATALGTVVFMTTVVHALYYAPEPEVSAPALEKKAAARKVLPVEFPDRLVIPAIEIDSAVLMVGVGKSGNMAVPPNYTDVGWYKYGTVPGQVGSAVIDGHVDNGLNLDGVFKHLSDLKIDDDVYIVTREGTRIHFVVTSIETYPYDQVPTDILFNRVDGARLNLITCEGLWVAGKKTYDHRLVIYTKLER